MYLRSSVPSKHTFQTLHILTYNFVLQFLKLRGRGVSGIMYVWFSYLHIVRQNYIVVCYVNYLQRNRTAATRSGDGGGVGMWVREVEGVEGRGMWIGEESIRIG